MGEHSVHVIKSGQERRQFVHRLLTDIKALELMIKEDLFEKDIQRIGAEQEFCVVDEKWQPSKKAPDLLPLINDDHFTTELGRYNLEINVDPFELKGDCFRKVEKQLKVLMLKAEEHARKDGNSFLITGILPTITMAQLGIDYMTPHARYYTLNDVMRSARGEDFELHINGVDELIATHDSVLFEACNTSFQMHLQQRPEEFVDQYNWSMAIAGPLLSAATNSPLLMGKELWSETRIALFQQSVDLRSSSNLIRDKQARVSFGNRWIKDSIVEIFQEDIARYGLLLTADTEEDSLKELEAGRIPKLSALNIHNGTIYKWNRACYGATKEFPHLRIENRYIPAGPTVIDELANFALWVGVMKGMPEDCKEIWKQVDFREAKANFIKAARTGIESEFKWFGQSIPARRLLEEYFLPMAAAGLKSAQVDEQDIQRLLGVIEKRIHTQTGSQWIVRNYRKLKDIYSKDQALSALTEGIYRYQREDIGIAEWKDIEVEQFKESSHSKQEKVFHAMSTDLFTVKEEDQLELVAAIMDWRKINHLPVENSDGILVGMLTRTDLIEKSQSSDYENFLVKDVMTKELFTIAPDAELENVIQLMQIKDIGCLPVVQNGEVIGIVTRNDLKKIKIDGSAK